MNQNLQSYIENHFLQWKGISPSRIETIAQAGGNRQYFRLFWGENESCIATYNPENITENEAFIYFTHHFNSLNLPVPQLFYLTEKKDLYFQSDEGKEALMDVLNREKYTKNVYDLYQKSLIQLAHLQIKGHINIDYNRCISSTHFDKEAMLYDLHYFFFYFVYTLPISYNRSALFQDFEKLANFLAEEENQYFLFRDFQSRNILVDNNQVHFIDYQGGMKGALQYDVVSLLWQAKAALPNNWKTDLLDYYFEQANTLLEGTLNKSDFYRKYQGFVLIRILQTLGSYGFRGLFEGRPYFLSAIPFALQQLKNFWEESDFPIPLPTLSTIFSQLTEAEMIARFQVITATKESKLIVKIKSFSYKKGIPKDESTNGGGYVFDCRGILNPGRYDAYKELTGRDEPVQVFLQTQTEMPKFLQHIYQIVDISVQNYLERDFDSLLINFGCTGGKHRSVFAADSVAKHLKEKFKVKIELEHRERGWEIENLA